MSQSIYPPLSVGARAEIATLTPNWCTESSSEVSLGKLQITPKQAGNLIVFGTVTITISIPAVRCNGATASQATNTWYFKVVDLFNGSTLLNTSNSTYGDFTFTVTLNFDHYFTNVSPTTPLSLLDLRGYMSNPTYAGGLYVKQIKYQLSTIYG